MRTHGNRSGLGEESKEVEMHLTLRGEGNAGRDHEHDDSELLVGLLNTECPRDKEDGDWGEGLRTSFSALTLAGLIRAYLEHLNVRYAQIEIGSVAEDKTAGEEHPNRQNGLEEHILAHMNVLGSVEEVCCALQYAGSNGCECKVPGDKEDGVLEHEGVVYMVVVEDDRRAEDNPDRNNHRCRELGLVICLRCSSNWRWER